MKQTIMRNFLVCCLLLLFIHTAYTKDKSKLKPFFINPKAAAESISYEDNRRQGTDRSIIKDIHIYHNKVFTVYGSWDNDNVGYVYICIYTLSSKTQQCDYKFGAHGIIGIYEHFDKLYFVADDPAEQNAHFPYQGLAIYDDQKGWQSISANQFKDIDGKNIWFAHGSAVYGIVEHNQQTLYTWFSSGNGTSTVDKLFKSTDGGLTWQTQWLDHHNLIVSYQNNLYSLNRNNTIHTPENYYKNRQQYGIYSNSVAPLVNEGRGWRPIINSNISLFPSYFKPPNGTNYFAVGNPVVFNNKIVYQMHERHNYGTLIDIQQSLWVTDLKGKTTLNNKIYSIQSQLPRCQGVPIGLQYHCRYLKLNAITATEQWLYVLHTDGLLIRTNDFNEWQTIVSPDEFSDNTLLYSLSVDDNDQFAYLGANKGQVFRIALKDNTIN